LEEYQTENTGGLVVLAFACVGVDHPHIATISAEVKCIHLEGSATNRAALIYSLFSQLKTDFLTLQRSIEIAQIPDLQVHLQVINDFGDDDIYNEVFDLMPDWIEAEIKDDLTMQALFHRQW
jgi:hypothetical protein